MSRLSDSRDPRGLGILILQHKDYDKTGFSLDLRGGLLAARVLDRDDRTGGLGSWQYDQDSVGDLNGALCWPNKTREIPGWAFAWPAILDTKNKDIATGGAAAFDPMAGIEGGGKAVVGRKEGEYLEVGVGAKRAKRPSGQPGAFFGGVRTNYSGGQPGATFTKTP